MLRVRYDRTTNSIAYHYLNIFGMANNITLIAALE
jgi:hypothetical protein